MKTHSSELLPPKHWIDLQKRVVYNMQKDHFGSLTQRTARRCDPHSTAEAKSAWKDLGVARVGWPWPYGRPLWSFNMAVFNGTTWYHHPAWTIGYLDIWTWQIYDNWINIDKPTLECERSLVSLLGSLQETSTNHCGLPPCTSQWYHLFLLGGSVDRVQSHAISVSSEEITGWWLNPTPLKNMNVNWDDYSPYSEK